MAEGEEEVNYASGVFKAGNNPPPAEKRGEETEYDEVKVQNERKNEEKRGEETVYDEVKVQNETKNEEKRGEETEYDEVKVQNETKNEAKRGEETVYDNVKVQNERKNEDSAGHRRFQHLAPCLGILCVILLGGIIGVCVHLANLTRDNKNLADQFGNLQQAYTVSESKVKNLKTQIQDLETQNNNLKQKINEVTANWNELSISRAQWSIDSYCLAYDDDKCQPCQHGWKLTESSCCFYNDPLLSGWKTWEEAQEDCKGKNSDLAVTHTPAEKEGLAINEKSFGRYEFWTGLRVEDGKWKWVDGSDLTESSWIPAPVEGHCALSVKGGDTVAAGGKYFWWGYGNGDKAILGHLKSGD